MADQSAAAVAGHAPVMAARLEPDAIGALPGFLANVSPRFRTPVAASVAVGVLFIGLTWVYLLATSVQTAFSDVIAVTGLLFAILYVLTALATIVYYRRRVFSGARDFLILGLLPLGAAAFLVWMLTKTLQGASAPQKWSLIGIVGLGLILLLAARFVLRSTFFGIRRESDA